MWTPPRTMMSLRQGSSNVVTDIERTVNRQTKKLALAVSLAKRDIERGTPAHDPARAALVRAPQAHAAAPEPAAGAAGAGPPELEYMLERLASGAAHSGRLVVDAALTVRTALEMGRPASLKVLPPEGLCERVAGDTVT